jgi:hypothetical protein
MVANPHRRKEILRASARVATPDLVFLDWYGREQPYRLVVGLSSLRRDDDAREVFVACCESSCDARFSTADVPETSQELLKKVDLILLQRAGPLHAERTGGIDERVDHHQASLLNAFLPSFDGHVMARVAGGRVRQPIRRSTP